MGFDKERLRDVLKTKGVSQSSLSKMSGLPQTTIASWLTGKGKPGYDGLLKVCDSLNISIFEITTGNQQLFDNMSGWVKLKVIGKVPAGIPIEAVEEFDGEILVPPDQARPGCYALKVSGDSMAPLILNGDIVVVGPCHEPYNGQTVVTRINSDGEVTLKKFQRDGKSILLVPENPAHQTRVLTPDSHIKILGCVISLHRRF